MLKCVHQAAQGHVSLLKTLNSVQTWRFCRTCIRMFYFSCIFSLEIPEYRNFLIFPHMTCVFFFLKNHFINISVKFGSYPRITLHICVLVCVCVYMYAYINTHTHTYIYAGRMVSAAMWLGLEMEQVFLLVVLHFPYSPCQSTILEY